MTTETDARERAAINLMTMTRALHKIEKQSRAALDKGDALGAGRRLERINMAAKAALDACDAQVG